MQQLLILRETKQHVEIKEENIFWQYGTDNEEKKVKHCAGNQFLKLTI